MYPKSPNKWSCLATAYAILTQRTVEQVCTLIGHDGSEIIRPDQPEPIRRRSFNFHEIIDLAVNDGYALTPIEAMPFNIVDAKKFIAGFEGTEPVFKYPVERFNKHLCRCSRGIITGKSAHDIPHACAYIDGQVIDEGEVIIIAEWTGTIEHLFRFDRIKSSDEKFLEI